MSNNLQLLRRALLPAIGAFCLVASLGVFADIAAAGGGSAASDPTGSWSGSYSGSYHGTFKLHWTETGSSLHGKITLHTQSGTGTTVVTGTENGGTITFGTVGPVGVITYTGTISGGSMSGTWKIKGGKGNGSWTAHKTA